MLCSGSLPTKGDVSVPWGSGSPEKPQQLLPAQVFRSCLSLLPSPLPSPGHLCAAAAARAGTLSEPGASSRVLDSSQPVWKLRFLTKEQDSIAKATPKDLCLLTWWEWPGKLLLVHSFSIKMHVSVQKMSCNLLTEINYMLKGQYKKHCNSKFIFTASFL